MVCSTKKSNSLYFDCGECGASIEFSPWKCEGAECSSCEKEYLFGENLSRQLMLFRDLCIQIHRSEEILGQTSVAIDLEEKQLRIPYNLLLTRLSSVVMLEIDGKLCELTFRIEPGKELALE